jgi:hypothetical protein
MPMPASRTASFAPFAPFGIARRLDFGAVWNLAPFGIARPLAPALFDGAQPVALATTRTSGGVIGISHVPLVPFAGPGTSDSGKTSPKHRRRRVTRRPASIPSRAALMTSAGEGLGRTIRSRGSSTCVTP